MAKSKQETISRAEYEDRVQLLSAEAAQYRTQRNVALRRAHAYGAILTAQWRRWLRPTDKSLPACGLSSECALRGEWTAPPFNLNFTNQLFLLPFLKY